MSTLPCLDAAALHALAGAADGAADCEVCAPLDHAGWDSMPGAFDRGVLRRVGTLRQPGDEEPSLQEHHPRGTHGWSADAPIAPAFHPYNRCELWQCTSCARAYLRYTEYGGYYQDERVRRLDAALIDDAPLPEG